MGVGSVEGIGGGRDAVSGSVFDVWAGSVPVMAACDCDCEDEGRAV
jgi:hypothetical protein